MLWLWCRPAAVAPIQPLAWELPYASGKALKRKRKKEKSVFEFCNSLLGGLPESALGFPESVLCSEEVREKPGYTGVLQQKPGGQNLQRLLFIKENRPLKLMNLLLFFVWEDGRVWAH